MISGVRHFGELEYLSIDIQFDGEPARQALLGAVTSDLVKRHGTTPAHAQYTSSWRQPSHASQAAVESGIESMAGVVRTGRLTLERTRRFKITQNIAIAPQVRHQEFAYYWFCRRIHTICTSLEALRMSAYRSPVLTLGECVFGKCTAEVRDNHGYGMV